MYFAIVNVVFKIDENAHLENYSEIEEYQANWLLKEINLESDILEAIKTHVRMQMDAEKHKPVLEDKCKELLKTATKSDVDLAVFYINNYKLHSSFNIVQLCN